MRWAAVMESEQKGSWEVLHKMNMRILMMTAAVVVGMGVGWVLPAQQAPAAASGPQWKSTKEFDEAQEYTKAKAIRIASRRWINGRKIFRIPRCGRHAKNRT